MPGKSATFWFSDAALSKDDLSSFIKSGKHDVQHLTAWATETGKGLLFYGESKGKVHGIFPLVSLMSWYIYSDQNLRLITGTLV